MATKTIFQTIVAVLVIALSFSIASCSQEPQLSNIAKFSSDAELKAFIDESGSGGYGGGIRMFGASETMALDSTTSKVGAVPSASDFSTTNVQVEGVDEADIVKNDGKYIYAASGSTVSIVNAYPSEDMAVASTITGKGNVIELFLSGDKLIVFSNVYNYRDPVYPFNEVAYYNYASSRVVADVYDISDRSEPELSRSIEAEGSYITSRMIGNNVYLVASQQVQYYGGILTLPAIKDGSSERRLAATNIYHFDEPGSQITNIISFDVTDDEGYDTLPVIGSYSTTVYASESAIYLASQKYMDYREREKAIIEDVYLEVLPGSVAGDVDDAYSSDEPYASRMSKVSRIISEYTDSLSKDEKLGIEERAKPLMEAVEERLARDYQRTIIRKISIDGTPELAASGSVPGYLLNQFSMDKFDGNLRLATTIQGRWTRSGQQLSSNNVYVLDEDLNVEGMLEGLAPGESIYSARFLGNRAYMVTFRKIDPLFVLDLSTPSEPKVLGKLKIPGYSDYLHPYSENLIIGLGKDAVGSDEGEFTWYQGVKLAMFDVSDVEHPKEISKVDIGDRGTDSYALHDHKAFLLSKSKGILVIPVLLAEIDRSKYAGDVPKYAYGDYKWQGAVVFQVSDSGFKEMGRVSHVADDSLDKSGYYWYSPYSIKRSLYMDDTLYTVSDRMIKANQLDDLDGEAVSIELSNAEEQEQPILYRTLGGTTGSGVVQSAVSPSSEGMITNASDSVEVGTT